MFSERRELQWGFFYILQIKCALSPTWTSNCTVLPLGSSKLCLTSVGDELVIHHIRQLIMQLFQSQENKRRIWRLWHHWLDWFVNLYVILTDSTRFKNHNNVFCIRFFSFKIINLLSSAFCNIKNILSTISQVFLLFFREFIQGRSKLLKNS